MKKLPILLFVLTVLFSVAAQAQNVPTKKMFAESETTSLKILLSKNNTGVINDITCPYCDFNFVKVTSNTKAFENGKQVDISRAAGRYGKTAFVRFNAKTAEIVFISWSE